MFVNNRHCSIGLFLLLLSLNVLCQRHRPQPQQTDNFGYPEDEEEDVSKNNDRNKTPVYLANVCRLGEILYPGDQLDDWLCDCKPGYLFYPAMRQCYPAYTRGPCRSGQYLILPINQIIPECLPNPCRRDNFVFFRGDCYELDKAGPCAIPEISNVVGVNATTLEIICTKDNKFNNGNISHTRTCFTGGIRWMQNKCPEQNNEPSDVKKTEETKEYTAADNACERHSKDVSSDEKNGWDNRNKYPWMAALSYSGEDRIFYSCNGIVISDTFILTTAACVTRHRNSGPRRNLRPLFARLGIGGIQSDHYIKDIISHPYYNKTTKKNDIALIRLLEPITFSTSIRPACLETDLRDEDSYATLTESGWGRHTERTTQMLKSNLQAMPLLQCNTTVTGFNKDKVLPALRHGLSKSQFCAYDPNNMGQSCRILSGGALQIFPSNSLLPKVVGVTSFGFGGGCSSKQPGIFTRIAHYVPWIEANVWPFDRRKTKANVQDRVNTNTGNSADDSSLILAAKNGHKQTVSLLIQNGADVNQVIDGETALHAVATTGHEKIARLLIHNGADFTIKNKDGKLASELALDKGYTQLARVLQENVAQKACDIYSAISVVTTRIWGGEEVTSDHEFPWMAALGYLDSSLRVNFNCGGTLISDKFILTAVHCVPQHNPPVVVRLGQINLNPDNTEKIPENHHVKDIIRHPDYSFLLKLNDIALIELENRIFFSETIRPACLQTYLSDENTNVNLTVTGWGLISSNPRSRVKSDVLLKANLKTVPSTECSTIMRNEAQRKDWTPFRNGTRQSHYCAADPKHMSDTCQGDSGGPLQIIRKNFDLSTVVGVVSTGPICGTSLPGIYTRVAYFIDWIESYVWPNGQIATPQINQAYE